MRAISLPLTAAERAAVDQLKILAGLAADADVLRLAVWRLGAHYDLPWPVGMFAIGGHPTLISRPPLPIIPAHSEACGWCTGDPCTCEVAVIERWLASAPPT